MHEPDDHDLLRQFAEQNSEPAFAALVARHVDKVYSAALRHTRNVHAAEEITQAVFVILAKKSGRLGTKVILAGWLYETARLTAVTYIRSEIRRARREQEAHMTNALNENDDNAWPHIAPLLDDALAGLSAADRHAVVLRYFDGKSLGEVGAALGASEDAAKKRVTRAVEKLRGWFTKRGVTLTATVLTAAISANSVQAAPLGLAATVTATAVKGAVVSGSTLTLIKGALKVMAWTKVKTAVVVGIAALFAAGTATVVIKEFSTPADSWKKVESFQQAIYNLVPPGDPKSTDDFPTYRKKMDDLNSAFFINVPPGIIIRQTRFPGSSGTSVAKDYDDNQILGRNLPFQDILLMSHLKVDEYGTPFPPTRMILPTNLPSGNYDFGVNVPDHGMEQFQEQIKNQFGLVGHFEMRATNVLALTMKNTNAPGLQRGADLHLMGALCYGTAVLAQILENRLNQYVIRETNLPLMNMQSFCVPHEATDLNSVNNVLLDNYGLELVPSREPVEMLVVEKVK
jgi:RNA polymerase sigma factor (sigma-70 family)